LPAKARIARLILCLILAAGSAWAESKGKVIYDFLDAPDGVEPDAALVFDSSGNLFGTTYLGGAYGFGTVFELSPDADSQWTESLPHSFAYGDDGAYPEDSLFVDPSGNLYGTTFEGGNGPCGVTCGTVFEVSLTGNGGWQESILLDFNGTDGASPSDNLIVGRDGAFYGTTQNGGAHGDGTVFELAMSSGGIWNETVLHSFNIKSGDGVGPYSGLVFDKSGNLYGTTYLGGAYNDGTVFELKPGSHGKWTESVIHSFDGNDGDYPLAGLTMDATGNMYGVCRDGGPHDNGTVFKLTRGGDGKWAFAIIHEYPNFEEGSGPVGTLIWDGKGNLYGITAAGGGTGCDGSGCGTVFNMSPRSNGKWAYTVLYRFNGDDGSLPEAGLIRDAKGNLYGATFYGGAHGTGVVFEVTP
jgi:uncharacterized repeat protein (TIGR03803 family)